MKQFTATLLTLLAASGAAEAQPIVHAPAGSMRGLTKDGVHMFRGIPYAKPPTGARRWKAPQPAAPWTSVRDCTSFGPLAYQAPSSRFPASSMSEDCLVLNVWTPATVKAPLPVMVWIHGGAFRQGSGHDAMYDGSNLAKAGAVVVTINYRLGSLGFLAHPSLSQEGNGGSGNYGLQDGVMALRWVKANAAAFGGDPQRVTIFGESAGGTIGRLLLVAPSARGLFHRAILESGPAGHLPLLRRPLAGQPAAEDWGQSFAERVLGPNVPADQVLSRLRQVAPDVLIREAGGRQGILDEGYNWGPVIDGRVLPDDPFALMASGAHANVPVIIGANADEAATFADEFPDLTPAEYRQQMRQDYGVYAASLLKALGTVRTTSQAKSALIRLHGDERFVMLARLGARQLSDSSQVPVYQYHFTRVSPQQQRMGKTAAHGAEIKYVFGNVSGTEQALSDVMLQTWVRFAATGNPNGDGVQWPRYTRSGDEHLEFGDQVKAGAALRQDTCDPLETKFLQDRGLPLTAPIRR